MKFIDELKWALKHKHYSAADRKTVEDLLKEEEAKQRADRWVAKKMARHRYNMKKKLSNKF